MTKVIGRYTSPMGWVTYEHDLGELLNKEILSTTQWEFLVRTRTINKETKIILYAKISRLKLAHELLM
jgi:hypothetical protein